ncbi:MAG TPA: urate oxidase [Bryobacteraceae bacterium]|jgi:urate oxidase|nr:urate oxidase [Bryobacteraceae bacterium]
MSTTLLDHNYGASRVRLIKVHRQQDRHDLKELSVSIQLEGEFESSYTSGDNRSILPADTIKNTVYALAKLYPIEQIEDFAQQLINHFLTDNPQVRKVGVRIAEYLWTRIPFGGKPHPWSFTPAGPERRTTAVTGTRDTVLIESGIENLQIVKTTGSGFEGYVHDPFTTLKETTDRILSAAVKANWLYSDNEIPFSVYWHGVRQAILDTFVEHESRSLQFTLHAMAEAVLERYADIAEIHLWLPNKDCRLVDLGLFGLENNNEVFAPAEEPYELIEARLRRESID